MVSIWLWNETSEKPETEPQEGVEADKYSLNTWSNNYVVITSKRRHFDVITSKWHRNNDVIISLRPSDAYICVSKLIIIGSDNGLPPGRRQAIIWTNAGILLIRPLGTNFNEMLIEILTFSFMKMRLKVSSAKWRPFCLGLNVSLRDVSAGQFPIIITQTQG